MKNKILEELSPMVSIGLIVYNGGKYLRGAIDSFLAQTFNDYEIIISDNASTDDTQIICEEYAALNHKIRYIRQVKNQGPIFNFKFVLEQARGDYFMWASHDDIFAPTYIFECLNVFKNNSDCVSVCSNFNVIDLISNKITEKNSPISRSSPSIFTRAIISVMDMHPNMIYGLHKTEIIRKIKIDTFDWFDIFINIQLSYYGKVLIIPKYLYDVGIDGPRKPYSMTGKYFSFKVFLNNIADFNKDKFSFKHRTVLFLYLRYITMKNKKEFNETIINWKNP